MTELSSGDTHSIGPDALSDPRHRVGVRAFLFLVLGASSALPLTIFGLRQAEQAASHEVENSDRQTRAASLGAALQLQEGILAVTRASETLSSQLSAPDSFDEERLQRALLAHTANHPEFIGAYVADERGTARVLVRNTGEVSLEAISYADRDYYQELLKQPRTIISKVGIGRFTKTLAVQVVAPILQDSGRMNGFTCSSLDLTDLASQAEKSVRGLASGRVVIVDSEGKRIADSSGDSGPGQRDFSGVDLYRNLAPGQHEVRTGRDDRAEEVRAAAVGLTAPVEGWRVIAMIPKREVDAQARHMRQNAAMFGGGLLVVALLTSALLAFAIARPLKQLAKTAKAVAHGDLQQRPVLMTLIPRELALLTLAMREMIRALREMTEDLAGKVAARTQELSLANVELDEALRTIRQHQAALNADIEKARHFQERMLPRISSQLGVDLACHFAPLERVGGDIYDVFEISKRHIRCFMGDVTGHGVQASMRTILLKSAYDRIKTHHADPSAVLTILNRYLVGEFPDGDLHCTACCVDIHLNSEGAELVYANAGGAPLFVFSKSATQELYAEGPLLGVDDVPIPGPFHHQMRRGELLVIASDGLTEQPDATHQRFESELAKMTYIETEPASEALSRILTSFEQFCASETILDDVTLVAIVVD